jgi:hypothetical protein
MKHFRCQVNVCEADVMFSSKFIWRVGSKKAETPALEPWQAPLCQQSLGCQLAILL